MGRSGGEEEEGGVCCVGAGSGVREEREEGEKGEAEAVAPMGVEGNADGGT